MVVSPSLSNSSNSTNTKRCSRLGPVHFGRALVVPFAIAVGGMVVLVSAVAVVVAILGDVVDWGPSVSDGPSLSLLQ